MTREEAIQFLDNMRGNENGRAIGAEGFYAELCGYHVQALNMAIKALEQEPCKDAISRQAALEKIHWLGLDNDTTIKCDLAIRALSPVNTQEPKTGHWINVNEGKWNTIPAYKCSACGANADLRDWSGESPFCPWCGARMESEKQA